MPPVQRVYAYGTAYAEKEKRIGGVQTALPSPRANSSIVGCRSNKRQFTIIRVGGRNLVWYAACATVAQAGTVPLVARQYVSRARAAAGASSVRVEGLLPVCGIE